MAQRHDTGLGAMASCGMSRFRKPSPAYWVMLGALLVVGVLWISDLFTGWSPKWFMLVFFGVLFLVNVFTFRTLWKQSDHPAFHPKKPGGAQ